MRRLHITIPLALLIGLTACAESGTSSAPSADGSAAASVPSGELIELGEGPVLDTTWRYALQPGDEGTCLVLEADGTAATRCGDPMPAEGEVFGEIGWAAPELTAFQALEGFVTEDVATVWLLGEGGYRIPATLVSLDETGFDGVVGFVGFADARVTLTHLQAVARSGEILDTLELEPR